MNLGQAIQNLRKKKNIKQTNLCKCCNITVSYLSQIENNKKEPSITILKNISKCLEVPLPVIFFNAITEEDIPPKKIESYKIIKPSLNNFISDFFIIE